MRDAFTTIRAHAMQQCATLPQCACERCSALNQFSTAPLHPYKGQLSRCSLAPPVPTGLCKTMRCHRHCHDQCAQRSGPFSACTATRATEAIKAPDRGMKRLHQVARRNSVRMIIPALTNLQLLSKELVGLCCTAHLHLIHVSLLQQDGCSRTSLQQPAVPT